jgi:hypothetical protein
MNADGRALVMGDFGRGSEEDTRRVVAGGLGLSEKSCPRWAAMLLFSSACRSCSAKFEFRVVSPKIQSVSLMGVILTGS